jgi:hypothetical protein
VRKGANEIPSWVIRLRGASQPSAIFDFAFPLTTLLRRVRSEVPMGMLQGRIRNTQWKADLFQTALYHSKWTIGTGEVSLPELPNPVRLRPS